MLFLSLPLEISDLIVEDLSKADWKRLVLVSKDFRNITRRFLWQSLYISNLEKFECIMDLFEKEVHLGRSVKNLTMDFARNLYFPFKTGRDALLKKPLSSITKNQFLRFIKFLPMIEELTFQDARFPPFTHLEVAEPLFPLVHTLTYYSRVEVVTNTLSSLLQMAPNVATLEFYTTIHEQNQTKQLKISSPLKSLACSFKPYFPLTDESFIPQSSIKKLQRLKIPDEDLNEKQRAILIDTLRFCSSTLLDISFLPQALDFEPFRSLLTHLKVLEALTLNLHNIPVDIFHLLPITLKQFWSYVTAEHLKHLYLYPRPLLALQELRFDTLDAETIQYLPESVVKINLIEPEEVHGGPNNMDLRKVFGWVKSRKRKNLRQICVYRPSDDSDNDVVVRKFKRMGIDLKIEEWFP